MSRKRKRSCRDCDADMTGVMPGSARYCASCESPSNYKRKPCRDCGNEKPPHPYNKSYCPDCIDRHAIHRANANNQRKRAARYGLTIDQLNELLSIGRCEACGSTEKLVVDHNHETEEVRGLLCDKCNKSLGLARDDSSVLRALAKYVDERGSY